ncbi:MAG: o-succinylbenzoate synthase [Actinomycetota bacterium]
MSAQVEAIELIRIRLPLVRPFTTSFGTSNDKDCLLVRAIGEDGVEGWGECTAMERPGYSYEYTAGAWAVLHDYLIPAALSRRADVVVAGHNMAKSALDVALTDLELRRKSESLASHLGAVRDRVPCGVSLGMEESLDDLLGLVKRFVDHGYQRVKLKIEPGRDVEHVRAVREAFPDTPLSVDANAAYTPETADALLPLDDLGLEYIEQPLSENDLAGHAQLQSRMQTAICLDETITSAVVARGAIELGACRVINVKLGRAGGLDESMRIHDLATSASIPLWVGGMLETGIGRAANVALASLPGFTMPGDTSASERYFERDVTEPFVVAEDGTMEVPNGPGIGVEPLPEVLEEIVTQRATVRP